MVYDTDRSPSGEEDEDREEPDLYDDAGIVTDDEMLAAGAAALGDSYGWKVPDELAEMAARQVYVAMRRVRNARALEALQSGVCEVRLLCVPDRQPMAPS